MIKIDMWYEYKPEEVTGINWSFYGYDVVYRGNLYRTEKQLETLQRTRCRKFAERSRIYRNQSTRH